LKTYLEPRQGGGSLNNDELLARQIVVQCDANYGVLLRRLKRTMGRIPDPLPLEAAMDRKVDAQSYIDLVNDPRVHRAESERKSRREPGSLPTFLSHLVTSMDREGLLFAHRVRTSGLNELEKLYTTSPPVSTEQILHPEKWFARERPVTIRWPGFETHAAFADWEVLDQGVLGELLLSGVFRAHHFSSVMGNPAAGWNGDRYAVFKRRGSADTLLLMYSAWDTETHAAEFAEAYHALVQVKHADAPKPVRLLEEGRRVVIVEGGDESSLDDFMKFAQSAQETQETPAVEK
jgi:hypothetical protein